LRATAFRDSARFGAEARAEAFGLALEDAALATFFRGATFFDWDRALLDATGDVFLGFGATAIRFPFRFGEETFLAFWARGLLETRERSLFNLAIALLIRLSTLLDFRARTLRIPGESLANSCRKLILVNYL